MADMLREASDLADNTMVLTRLRALQQRPEETESESEDTPPTDSLTMTDTPATLIVKDSASPDSSANDSVGLSKFRSSSPTYPGVVGIKRKAVDHELVPLVRPATGPEFQRLACEEFLEQDTVPVEQIDSALQFAWHYSQAQKTCRLTWREELQWASSVFDFNVEDIRIVDPPPPLAHDVNTIYAALEFAQHYISQSPRDLASPSLPVHLHGVVSGDVFDFKLHQDFLEAAAAGPDW
jgi:hypothetical protein